jgi:hypothetical protein
MRMRSSLRIAVAVVSLAAATLLAPGPAAAADYCITFGGDPDIVFVGKNFRLPAPGQCKPWHGFLVRDFPALFDVSIATGTGCASSDGDVLRLHLGLVRENVSFQVYIILPLPAATGGILREYVTGQSGFGPSTTSLSILEGSACDPRKVRVP